MRKAKMIEKEEDLVCSKKHSNEQIIFYNQDKNVKIQDRLLCQKCLGCDSKGIENFQNFQDMRENIQENRDQLYEQCCQQVEETISKINRIVCCLGQAIGEINQKFNQFQEKAQQWISNLIMLGENMGKYKLYEELESFDQSFQEKSLKSSSNISSYNNTFCSKIQNILKDFTLIESVFECESQLQEIVITEYCKQETYVQYNMKQIQAILENEVVCPVHNSKIILIDHNQGGEKKEERMKCGFCKQGQSITISKFQQEFQEYQKQKLLRIKDRKEEDLKRLAEVKSLYNKLLIASYQCRRDIVSKIDERIVFHTQLQLFQKNDEFAQYDQIIQMEEELTQYKKSKISQDEIKYDQDCQNLYQYIRDKMNMMTESTESHQNTEKIIISELTKDIRQYQSFTSVKYETTDFVKEDNFCYAIVFNNDGSIMISGCKNKIKVWRFENGKLKGIQEELEGHATDILCLVFSKKTNSFFSASDDGSILFWQDVGKYQWQCQQPGPQEVKGLQNFFNKLTGGPQQQEVNQKAVTCLLLDKNEEELISGSVDGSIIIWKVNIQKNQFNYKYTVTEEQYFKRKVFCISLNESETILIAGFSDKLQVWRRANSGYRWKSSTYCYSYQVQRICFFSDTKIIFSHQDKCSVTILELQDDKEFIEKPELEIQLKQASQDTILLFPAVLQKEKKVILLKHTKFVYIISLLDDGQLSIRSDPINCFTDYSFGGLTNDGQYIAIWNQYTKQIRVHGWKQE